MSQETPENRQTVRLMLKDLIRAQKHTTGTAHEFVSSTTNLFESIVKTETKGSVVPEEMAAPDAAKQRAKNAQITTLLDDFDDFLEEKLPLFDALNDRAEASQTRPIMRANAQRMTKTRG
ncbi:hypothetical protein SARC_09863 [Sphaeroforma arctica JP610]|uniref:Uncharacterized protein n=1 Tax=Sphaeroforma arctica JP610 TaxID=667725 RepID=A0A0L0FLM5_9EUKA|nr:hypothetical protein SARC_09863 [Sphaeroforma arctica JP610]KNC77679.1 hypothetical protein SARC_09863 [Sphaeroforma arctica JP610]|eukprot:XP_014151581.1 hypothetical protein SARC_09863 [Sphaeroforma arctica JP610]